MRFTVTPLGGGRADTARIVNAIVRYLQPAPSAPGPRAPAGSGGPEQYYADRGEEPGRWLGRTARSTGLTGAVEPDDLAAALAGRDPHTGERLITAQGSAGRRPTLGVGACSRVTASGEALYDVADAAAVLSLSHREVERMLDVGTAVAAGTAIEPDGTYLEPVSVDGARWVTASELGRCETARSSGVPADAVRSLGSGGDQLSLPEAARLAGVSARYLRSLARHHEDHHAEIDETLAAGRGPRRAFLAAHRGTRGQWLVTRDHLAEFLDRRRPPAVRVAYDLTLTTEKSLGVLALLSSPPVGAQVLGAIQAGNDWALGWLEDHAAGRVDGAVVPVEGLMVASFRHLTSRALDPFPHHHNVVLNTVRTPDGSRRALDARVLYRHANAASALATAEMRHRLAQDLDVRWRTGRRSGWEIDGISPGVVAEFSQRRNEIDDALAELEAEIGRGAKPAEVDHIVLRTRPAKTHTHADALVEQWRQRAAARGLDTAHLDDLGRPAQHDTQQEVQHDVVFDLLARPDGICANQSVFGRADAIAALADLGAAGILRLTDAFLASRHVVRLTDTDEALFTTTEMLAVQHRIATRFARGHYQAAHVVADDRLDVTLADHDHLTDEQRHLVTAWCQSGHRFQTAIGRAGTGKTTTVAACADAWSAAGYRVVGAAVKGEAARTLAAATGMSCETVAWYLTHTDPDRQPLDARTVLVVDEASTLADRDLDALMTMAARTGASIRLIGDPAQHGAIAAGGMFRALCDAEPEHTPELTTTHRLRDPHDRAAAEALREGHIDEAFDLLAKAGHLHVLGDELTMYRHVLARWWDAHQAGADHPMVDRRNITRRQLNRLAHLLRRANGELGPDHITATGNRTFAVGDRITARAPNRDLHVPGDRSAFVRNGALGTITALRHGHGDPDGDIITVDFDGIGTIELPRSFFDHHQRRGGRAEVGIDHAYALTSYAVQGSTHAVSTSRVDPTATRAETYVDITRGRDANHLYLTAAADPLDGEALPRVPPPPADLAVAERLHRSTSERTAWELAQVRAGALDARGVAR